MAQQDSEHAEPAQRITHRQAAELLSSHISFISKLLARGELHTTGLRGPGVGTLDLDEVLKVREARLRAERERRLRYDRVDPPRKGPPTHLGDHEWLSVEQVARRLGRTESAVRARAKRDTIPHVRHDGRIWVRADHLRTWMRAQQVTGPEDLGVSAGRAWTSGVLRMPSRRHRPRGVAPTFEAEPHWAHGRAEESRHQPRGLGQGAARGGA